MRSAIPRQLSPAQAAAREDRLVQLWETLPPCGVVPVDSRPKAEPGEEVSVLHARAIRIGVECVQAYLSGQSDVPVEDHPGYQAAIQAWHEADQGPKKSQFI